MAVLTNLKLILSTVWARLLLIAYDLGKRLVKGLGGPPSIGTERMPDKGCPLALTAFGERRSDGGRFGPATKPLTGRPLQQIHSYSDVPPRGGLRFAGLES